MSRGQSVYMDILQKELLNACEVLYRIARIDSYNKINLRETTVKYRLNGVNSYCLAIYEKSISFKEKAELRADVIEHVGERIMTPGLIRVQKSVCSEFISVKEGSTYFWYRGRIAELYRWEPCSSYSSTQAEFDSALQFLISLFHQLDCYKMPPAFENDQYSSRYRQIIYKKMISESIVALAQETPVYEKFERNMPNTGRKPGGC